MSDTIIGTHNAEVPGSLQQEEQHKLTLGSVIEPRKSRIRQKLHYINVVPTQNDTI